MASSYEIEQWCRALEQEGSKMRRNWTDAYGTQAAEILDVYCRDIRNFIPDTEAYEQTLDACERLCYEVLDALDPKSDPYVKKLGQR